MNSQPKSFTFKVTFTCHEPMATSRCSATQVELRTVKDYSESLALAKLKNKLTKELKYDDVTFTIESRN